MQALQRIIRSMPLDELWDDSGVVAARWIKDLAAAEIRELLNGGAIRWVVADIGKKPKWIPELDGFTFWKEEVKPRLVDGEYQARLQDFPGEYCYTASEWRDARGRPVVLLYRHH
ncbi:MAG TPA: hypothetical protein VMS17_32965 [Gemmataceae bacterium]|nr:hypothetical protein [Gemmataceae bacterium]